MERTFGTIFHANSYLRRAAVPLAFISYKAPKEFAAAGADSWLVTTDLVLVEYCAGDPWM
jgi:hypothetical protein